MLAGIAIRDLLLIDRLDLAFGPNLNALTGETGAGKSILLEALGLAMGERAEAGLVRSGAAQASVTTEFDLSPRHPARPLLAEHGITASDRIVLRRVLGADGRSRAFVDDQPVAVGFLKQLGLLLVARHAQGEAVGLFDHATHRAALDRFAGHTPILEQTRAAHAAWQSAVQAAAEAESLSATARTEEAYLRHALEELIALDPKQGEEPALAERRQTLQRSERIGEAIATATREIADGRGVAVRLATASRVLARAEIKAAHLLDAAIAALDRAAAEAAEAENALARAAAEIEAGPSEIEAIEERLFALRAAARKYRTEPDSLAALAARYAGNVAQIDGQERNLAERREAAKRAKATYLEAAGRLTASRNVAAAGLEEALARELPALKLRAAKLRVAIEALGEPQYGPEGLERVAFEFAANPGVPFGPLSKIASGGEMSRLMLALRVVLARDGEATTLVFDEADAGVGGATAAAVGERLVRLARHVQILAVTHSPQVAARAQHHFRVAKQTSAGNTTTTVQELDAKMRREEIARMLSGARVTDAARAAADTLIAGTGP
jgi:DNA repair protein RecN (Recombination protein N)